MTRFKSSSKDRRHLSAKEIQLEAELKRANRDIAALRGQLEQSRDKVYGLRPTDAARNAFVAKLARLAAQVLTDCAENDAENACPHCRQIPLTDFETAFRRYFAATDA